MKIAPNYRITNIRVNPAGETIEALEINGEAVEMGSAKLENNKAATIDVSTYTEPVEVTPTSGKTGMKKVTVTLSNIPSAGAKLAKWTDGESGIHYFNIEAAPEEGTDILQITVNDGVFSKSALVGETDTYAKTSDTVFTVTDSSENTVTYTRDSTGDVTIW